jgi:cysteine-rich repeat protein
MPSLHFVRRRVFSAALAALAGLLTACTITVGGGCPEGEVCEVEPNDLRAEATPISFGQAVTGDIGGFDTDVFAITLSTTSDIKLDVLSWSGAASCSDLWIDLELLDSAGNVLEEDSGSGEGFCPTIDAEDEFDWGARGLPPGTYFARLTWSGSDTRDYGYTLVARQVSACGDGNALNGDSCSQKCEAETSPEVEPNDTPEQATLLTPPAVARATFGTDMDLDYFRFTLAAPAGVVIRTTDWDGEIGCYNVDTAVELRTADGVLLASNDDVSDGYCSSISPASVPAVRSLAAGSYVVRVRQYFRATEGYHLSVVTQAPAP